MTDTPQQRDAIRDKAGHILVLSQLTEDLANELAELLEGETRERVQGSSIRPGPSCGKRSG